MDMNRSIPTESYQQHSQAQSNPQAPSPQPKHAANPPGFYRPSVALLARPTSAYPPRHKRMKCDGISASPPRHSAYLRIPPCDPRGGKSLVTLDVIARSNVRWCNCGGRVRGACVRRYTKNAHQAPSTLGVVEKLDWASVAGGVIPVSPTPKSASPQLSFVRPHLSSPSAHVSILGRWGQGAP